MYQAKLMNTKECRQQQRNASRVLQEESERITNEFLRIIVGGNIGYMHHSRRSAKLTNWEEDSNRKKTNIDQSPSKKVSLPTRYKFKRKRFATIESEVIESGSKDSTIDYQNQPTFSISFLNPLLDETVRVRPSQKLKKMREKAASNLRNRFIQHLTQISQNKGESQLQKKNRVHSLNSQSKFTPTKEAQLIGGANFDYFINHNTKKLPTVKSQSRSMESILRRKTKVQEILQIKNKDKDNKKASQVAKNPYLDLKFQKSKQFQKLRMLLTLEKI